MIGIVVFVSGLVAALVAALRLGAPARLDAKQAIAILGKAMTAAGVRILLLIAVVLALAYTFDVSARLAWLGLLLWMLAFALHTFHRRGANSLAAVALVCAWFLMAFVWVLQFGSRPAAWLWIPVPILALLVPLTRRPRLRFRRWLAGAAVLTSAAIAFLAWPAILDRSDARKFAEAFDAENPRWDVWARIAQRTGGDFARQAARIHAALDAGEEVRASTLVEFARLDLLRNEDYAPFLDAGTVRFYLSGTSTLGARGELTIRGLLARGELTEEQRRGLARRNVSGLPGYPEYGSLEDWRDGLFALEALGFRDLARERASDVATVLDAHWTGNAGDRPFAAAFDYAPYPEEPDDSPSCIAPTADAVALMVEFGAPPEIDLERLAFYLTSVARESRTHRRAQRVLAGLALAEFEERFDPGVLHRLRGRPLLWIASVCAAAVAVLAVLRARPLEGGEEVHGGGDEPVQEHAGPDAVRA